MALPAVAFLAVALGGCASEPRETAPEASPSGPTAGRTSIVLDIDGVQVAGELDRSATAASLISALPLTVTMRDYAGQELIGKLPEALSLDGAPKASAAKALTIGYYAPQQSLVLYHADVGSFAGIVPIGNLTDAAAVTGHTREVAVTIRLP